MSEKLYKANASCLNCSLIRDCDKPHDYKCSDFKLYGSRSPKPRKSKSLCSMCRNDWYNYGTGLKQSGGKGCWSYKDAKVVLKTYHMSINRSAPWPLEWQLSCCVRRL